jgi:hypothetical protein
MAVIQHWYSEQTYMLDGPVIYVTLKISIAPGMTASNPIAPMDGP